MEEVLADDADRRVVRVGDTVIDRQRKFRATVVEHAQRGIPGAVAEVADGYLDTVDGWIAWSESNRHLLDPSARRPSRP